MKIVRPPNYQASDTSIFLAGPTPRSPNVKSWRVEMLQQLEKRGFTGTVFVPEPEDGEWSTDYIDQVDWELYHLAISTVILFWVPRDLETMPAFTTNVEFGMYIKSGKLIYGRPDDAPKNKYLDYLYRNITELEPCSSIRATAILAINKAANKKDGPSY